MIDNFLKRVIKDLSDSNSFLNSYVSELEKDLNKGLFKKVKKELGNIPISNEYKYLDLYVESGVYGDKNKVYFEIEGDLIKNLNDIEIKKEAIIIEASKNILPKLDIVKENLDKVYSFLDDIKNKFYFECISQLEYKMNFDNYDMITLWIKYHNKTLLCEKISLEYEMDYNKYMNKVIVNYKNIISLEYNNLIKKIKINSSYTEITHNYKDETAYIKVPEKIIYDKVEFRKFIEYVENV